MANQQKTNIHIMCETLRYKGLNNCEISNYGPFVVITSQETKYSDVSDVIDIIINWVSSENIYINDMQYNKNYFSVPGYETTFSLKKNNKNKSIVLLAVSPEIFVSSSIVDMLLIIQCSERSIAYSEYDVSIVSDLLALITIIVCNICKDVEQSNIEDKVINKVNEMFPEDHSFKQATILKHSWNAVRDSINFIQVPSNNFGNLYLTEKKVINNSNVNNIICSLPEKIKQLIKQLSKYHPENHGK